MNTDHRVGVGHGSIAALGALAVALTIGMVSRLSAQDRDRDRDRDRDAGAASPREGGIPRRALGSERERDRQEGTEEGVPEAGVQPRLKEFAPRIAPPRGDWKLGVWVYNTDTGVVITRVQRGSAAERRGLERGDRIVSVGGYQVGYVGDYLYPLGYELQRQVDRRGNVLLLVQNVRNNELTSFEVRLESASGIRPLPTDRFRPPWPSAPARPGQ